MLDNVYKESLRSMIYSFGNLYYIDGNGNRLRVKTTHGNPERIAGKLKADNTLILPMITIVETKTTPDLARGRYQSIIIEKAWDPTKLKATRVLSLPPRPVNISYEINIWAKYKANLDQIVEQIRLMFNPHLVIKNSYTNVAQAFIEQESDNSTFETSDRQDRIIRRTFTIKLEGYIPNPRFLVTSTGEVEQFNSEATIY